MSDRTMFELRFTLQPAPLTPWILVLGVFLAVVLPWLRARRDLRRALRWIGPAVGRVDSADEGSMVTLAGTIEAPGAAREVIRTTAALEDARIAGPDPSSVVWR